MFGTIRGKRVLITGATSGIGSCTAELFGRYGALVGIHYRGDKESASVVALAVREQGGEAILIPGDLLDPPARDAIVPGFIRDAGGLEILVNNAGAVIGNSHFLDLDTRSWEQTLQLNLTAPFILSREAFRHMKDHGGGRILNITSIAAKYGGSEKTIHYGAAKAGLEALTRTMARAGAPHKILVNAIAPGVIDTPFHARMGRTTLNERVKSIPLQRAGTPMDVARLCLFLASEAGDYITGQVYGVTGGD
jgi:3-oxoacyl-[acyl-carrier protein] reductase